MVAAGAERQHVARIRELTVRVVEEALGAELGRRLEPVLVAVRRCDQDDQLVVGLNGDAVELGRLGRAPDRALHRRIEAQGFCREAQHVVGIVDPLAEPVPLVPVEREMTKQARQRPLDGLDPGREQEGDGGDDLARGVRLAFVARRREVGDHVATRLPPPLLDDRSDDLAQAVERLEGGHPQ